MTRSRRFTALVGMVVLAVLSLTGCEAYDLPLPGSPVDKDHSFEITADFRDVLSLVPRSPVKVNDVTVGEVTSVARDGWHATTTLRIQDDVKLPENVFADIRQTSLLGEKYVALMPAPGQPETGRLHDGEHLGLDQTGRNPELEEVLGALSFLLNGGGVGQLKTITTEVNKIFHGRQDRVRHVLGQLDVLIRGLDEQKGDIIKAMEGMNALSATLNRERSTVTGALDSLGPAVKVLADQRAQFMRMLGALDRLGKVGTRVIGQSKESMLADLRDLYPIVREVAKANDKIPEALGLLISFPFPIESNDIVHGDYANTSIVFSIDLNNLYQNFIGNNPGLPGLPNVTLPCSSLPNPQLGDTCKQGGKIVKITKKLLGQLNGGGGNGGGPGGLDLPGGLPKVGLSTHTTSFDGWNHYATSVSQLAGGAGA
jgi:phospholipid/cholesterol/gamma-HCH transport system substrate-binding protein